MAATSGDLHAATAADSWDPSSSASSVINALSPMAVSNTFNELGVWVRKTKYQLTLDELQWVTQSRLDVLRRQSFSFAAAFGVSMLCTHPKFPLGSGPPRRLPIWGRLGVAGCVAYTASGVARIGANRLILERLAVLPDSALADHIRDRLHIPAPRNARAEAGTPNFNGSPSWDHLDAIDMPAPAITSGAQTRSKETLAGLESSAAAASEADRAWVEPKVLVAPKSEQRLNSWDRLRQERQQLASGSPSSAKDARTQMQTHTDGSVEAGTPRVVVRKNRWGDVMQSELSK